MTPTALPEEITKAIDDLEDAVKGVERAWGPNVRYEKDELKKARADLEAAIRKWGDERRDKGIAEGYPEGYAEGFADARGEP